MAESYMGSVARSRQKQEALLPQTDRAMRYVSQNLVQRRNKLYDKSK